MAWCHYLSQYWPRSLSPYDLTRPQWVMGYITQGFINGQHFAKYIFMNENHEMIQISLKFVTKDSIDNMSSVLVMAWCLTTVRILGPLWPRPWPWIYKVKCWKQPYLRHRRADWHGTRVDRMWSTVTLNFDLTSDLYFRFQGQILKYCISGMGVSIGMRVDKMLDLHYPTLTIAISHEWEGQLT